ncbi:MAG: efflux RND transporter periplasmic adaptor subunit [Anaerolineae bacterium]|nr:efflux RND transporter periplasmic adaptor subunit [Anaerolineae bacterium]
MKKRFTVLLILLGLLNTILVGCGSNEPTQQAAVTPSGETVAVDYGTTGVINATGTVVPARAVKLSFQTGGQVEELTVSIGDDVEADQLLARLDDNDLVRAAEAASLLVEEASVNVDIAQKELERLVKWAPNAHSVAAAEAALANAEASLEVAQADYDQVAWMPGVSASAQSLQLEQATNNYNVAKSNVDYLYSSRPDTQRATDNLALADLVLEKAELNWEIAQDALKKAILRAPFFGTITAVNIQEEEVAAAGAPVIEIIDTEHWQVETKDIGELTVDQVSIGQEARVTVNAFQGEALTGTVVGISPVAIVQLGDTTYTVTIELEPTDLDLRWGMTVKVAIPLGDGG